MKQMNLAKGKVRSWIVASLSYAKTHLTKKMIVPMAVFLAIIIMFTGVVFANRTTPPAIMSGVTHTGTAKLNENDETAIKLNVPSGKYIAMASDGVVYDVQQVKNGKITFKTTAGDNPYKATLYAVNRKPKIYSKANKLNSFGFVKIKVPAGEYETDADDDEDTDTDTEDTAAGTEDEETDADTDDDSEDSESDSQESIEDQIDDLLDDSSDDDSYISTITYDNLARKSTTYIFQSISMTGRVVQVQELSDEDKVQCRVAINGDYNQIVLIEFRSSLTEDSHVLEDDKITFYGVSLGQSTYTATSGQSVSLPFVAVQKLKNAGRSY